MTAYEMAEHTTMTRTEVDEAIEGLVDKGVFQVIGHDEFGHPRYGYTGKGERMMRERHRGAVARFFQNAWDGWCDFAGDDERAFWLASGLIGGCVVLAFMLYVQHVFGFVP